MGWDGGFIESVWECYIILGVSVVPRAFKSDLFIHTCWKSHFPFFLFRLQEGKLVPANITVELLLQVCCRWSFLANSDNFHSQETGHWVMHQTILGKELWISAISFCWWLTSALQSRLTGTMVGAIFWRVSRNDAIPSANLLLFKLNALGKSWLCRMLVP